ncbi:MAG TPA: hypothetical protein VGL77_08780 [Armatimonadota bacterium]|jgi:hypothetical protein
MPAETPKPTASLDLLLDSVPAKAVLAIIKADLLLAQLVFHGFSAREKSLHLTAVRQRLAREVEKQPELAEKLHSLWLQHYAQLSEQLNAADFLPGPATLSPLRDRFGVSALHYGLQYADREEVRAWADQLAEMPPSLPHSSPSVAPVQHVVSLFRGKTKNDLQEREQAQTEARQALQREVARLEKLLAEQTLHGTELQKQLADAERRVAREQRRAKKAEETAEHLQKSLKRQQQEATQTPPPVSVSDVPPPPETAALRDAVHEALAILQRGLTTAAPPTPAPVSAPASAPARAPKAAGVTKSLAVTVTLPTPRGGKQHYVIPQLLVSLRRNDEAVLDAVRDGIAMLAQHPARERAARAELTKAGIPDALLTGPLRPAIVDGSNVANLNPEQRRAQMAYLLQVQRAAWQEGYFPVILIVDASLRHQIDRADLLMEMVERGEVLMAQAGTSADELLLEEAERRHAVLITNDRMSEWPAARTVERRHIELIGGTACLGGFQRSSSNWFH